MGGRLMSRGKRAMGNVYGWASDGAGRVLPRASSFTSERGKWRNMIEDRPLMLGALGLGIGAILGMMMPSRLTGGRKSSRSPSRGRGRQSTRKKS